MVTCGDASTAYIIFVAALFCQHCILCVVDMSDYYVPLSQNEHAEKQVKRQERDNMSLLPGVFIAAILLLLAANVISLVLSAQTVSRVVAVVLNHLDYKDTYNLPRPNPYDSL
ncbi:hypothetical protein FA95DRAFT_1606011 [Auriscalpium vulgare]|uniref:Uncharacterized protein n=1 Tax=Auriscalpium vulgare TaxID=40419 RepID=A0ACB8RTK3_9AGAM|nr:hypothetical protein FA95DRAFT_1606011 [Auriscalpium vulgare]